MLIFGVYHTKESFMQNFVTKALRNPQHVYKPMVHHQVILSPEIVPKAQESYCYIDNWQSIITSNPRYLHLYPLNI